MNAVNLHIFFRKLIKILYSLILNPPSTTVMESFNKKPQWIPVNLSGICGALTWPRFARSLWWTLCAAAAGTALSNHLLPS